MYPHNVSCIFRTRTSYQTINHKGASWGKAGKLNCHKMPKWDCLGRGLKFSLSYWSPKDCSLRTVAKGSLTRRERGIFQSFILFPVNIIAHYNHQDFYHASPCINQDEVADILLLNVKQAKLPAMIRSETR